MFKKIIIFLIIITIGMGIIGFYYYQKKGFSLEDIKFEILAPETVEMMQKITYRVRIRNLGETTLEDVHLIFEFPPNSLVEENNLRIRKKLENIHPGQEKNLSFPARLIGKKGEAKIARAFLSYRPRNLEAFFESSTTHLSLIEFVPLTLNIDLPSRIKSPALLNFSINYFSNSPLPLYDLGIKVDYPQNFEFLESQPITLGKEQWDIGLLNQGEGGRIKIQGNLIGEIKEIKTFKAQLGIWREGKFIVLKETIRATEIVKPSIYISQTINNCAQYIASPGDFLHFKIFFKNIGERALENLSLIIDLESELLDYYTLFAKKGRFRRGGNIIILDQTMMPELNFLAPMAEGKFEFWINVKEEPVHYIENPVIKNTITLGDYVTKEFTTKINSVLKLDQVVYFDKGPFRNTGPHPPRLNFPTTYTIIWHPRSFYNQINDLKIKTILPLDVELSGEFLPKDAQFSFNPDTREFIWKIDKLLPEVKFLNPELIRPKLAFQIVLSPGENQKKEPFKLLDTVTITGKDVWTETILETEIPAIDTDLINFNSHQ